MIEDDYDADRIDGHRYAVATEKVKAELQQAESSRDRLTGTTAATALLRAADPVTTFDQAPLMIQHAVIDALIVIHVHPWPQGKKGFDPRSVTIEPRGPGEHPL